MKAHVKKATCSGAAVLLLLLAGIGTALADTSCSPFSETACFPYRVGGEIELGGGFFVNDPSQRELGYLQQYNTWEGVFLNMNLFALSEDDTRLYELYSNGVGVDLEGQNLGGNALFRTEKLGLYTFELEYNNVNHLLSTVDPFRDDISVKWDIGRLGLLYSPTSDVDVLTEYRIIHRGGDIPDGVSEYTYIFPGAFSFKPILKPIDDYQHNLTVAAEYAQPKYQLRLAYDMSLYENDYTAIRTIPGSSDPYLSLPPDNMANYATIAGGVTLPYRTRINSAFSYGWLIQDDQLAPVPGVVGPSSGATSDIDVSTMLAYLNATSRPIDPLTLYASYRYSEYNDDQKQVDIPGQGESLLRSHRAPYDRHDAKVEGKWQFCFPASINVGYRFDYVERDWPEGGNDTETHTPRIALNVTPLDWLNASVSYYHQIRYGTDYDGPPEYFVVQRFDEADRDRDAVGFTLDLTPWNKLTFSTNFSLYSDSYSDTYHSQKVFGLQEDEGWSAGADVSWTPLQRLSLSAGYLHENYDTRQRAISNVDIDPGSILKTGDTFDTFSIGSEFVLIPDKLTHSIRYSYSYANSDFHNEGLPDLENQLNRVETYLKYRFTKCWFTRLGYVFEDYDISNAYSRWARNVEPVEYDLDGYYKDGTAHMIYLTVGYKF